MKSEIDSTWNTSVFGLVEVSHFYNMINRFDDFKLRNKEYAKGLCVSTGLSRIFADHVFRMMILIASGHLGIRDTNKPSGRVFVISKHLPLELKYKLCNALFFCSTKRVWCSSTPEHFKIIFNLFLLQ
jgi:hypothetical protein